MQYELVRSIRGFEQAHLTRPGYAIEYDFFDPRDLSASLQTRAVGGLFFAGQINGTTGYEEAAAQGLLAGINAVQRVREQEPWTPKRSEAYLGVLVDDLITRGAPEPYRMFTSRAEHRLLLREDNADLRLTPRGRELGLVEEERWRLFNERSALARDESERLATTRVKPQQVSAAWSDRVLAGVPLARDHSALELLKRPGVGYADIIELAGCAVLGSGGRSAACASRAADGSRRQVRGLYQAAAAGSGIASCAASPPGFPRIWITAACPGSPRRCVSAWATCGPWGRRPAFPGSRRLPFPSCSCI